MNVKCKQELEKNFRDTDGIYKVVYVEEQLKRD